jgi:hypothetical protein
MPGGLHAQLAHAAEREHLSLNRFVINVLAASVSPDAPVQSEAAAVAQSEAAVQASEQPLPGAYPQRALSRAFRIGLAINVTVVVLAAVAAVVLLVLALHSGI